MARKATRAQKSKKAMGNPTPSARKSRTGDSGGLLAGTSAKAEKKQQAQAIFNEFNEKGALLFVQNKGSDRWLSPGLLDSLTVLEADDTGFWLLIKQVGYWGGPQYSHIHRITGHHFEDGWELFLYGTEHTFRIEMVFPDMTRELEALRLWKQDKLDYPEQVKHADKIIAQHCREVIAQAKDG
jgi:hypothetical protein